MIISFLIGFCGVLANLLAFIVFKRRVASEKIGDSLRITMMWLALCDLLALIAKVYMIIDQHVWKITMIWLARLQPTGHISMFS